MNRQAVSTAVEVRHSDGDRLLELTVEGSTLKGFAQVHVPFERRRGDRHLLEVVADLSAGHLLTRLDVLLGDLWGVVRFYWLDTRHTLLLFVLRSYCVLDIHIPFFHIKKHLILLLLKAEQEA